MENGLKIYGLNIRSLSIIEANGCIKKLRECVENKYINIITDDSMKVVVMKKEKLINGRNVSRYNYYILRLCSRRGITLECHLNDLIDSKAKNKFDNRLFGVVYKKLG